VSIVDRLERLGIEWAEARPANHRGLETFFKLRCAIAWGGVSPPRDCSPPVDLAKLWSAASGARLFVDDDYGQWGLVLFSPAEAVSATGRFQVVRPEEFRHGDLIVGEFIGDSDVLLVRCDPLEPDYGAVLIPTPLEGRPGWTNAAASLDEFLGAFERTHGDKFWE
jgi:hypothetical protein